MSVANVNDAPRLAGLLDNRRATEGVVFSATIPTARFIDIDAGDQLVFSAELASGAALPDWLVFDAGQLSLRGTPGNADIGQLLIRITATDMAGASVSGTFRLTVDNRNDAPTVNLPLPDQQVAQDQPFDWMLPAGLFTDIDVDDVLSLRATLASGADLPAWLNFDAATLRFSGTPGNGDVGELQIRVTASDIEGASVSGDFELRVSNVNDAPQLLGANDLAAILESQFGNPGTRVADLIKGLVSDIDASAVAGIAVVGVDASHGSWQYSTDGRNWIDFGLVGEQSARLLAADATTAVRFVPIDRWRGQVAAGLTLRAWDQSSGVAGELASIGSSGGTSPFSSETAVVGITVTAVNHAPERVLPLIDRSVVDAEIVEWRLPAASFADSDADDVLTYRANLDSGAPLPAWLNFDPATLTFKGSPKTADIGTMTIRVTVTDAAGAAAQSVFVVNVAQAPSIAIPPEFALAEVALPIRAEAVAEPAAKPTGFLVAPAERVQTASAGSADGVLASQVVLDSSIKLSVLDRIEYQKPVSRDDAVLASLPTAQFGALVVSATPQWLNNDDLLRKFDDLQHQMKDLGQQQQQIIASSLAISSGLSIGYVVWLVRGGVLLSSMLSALPAWQMIDPMPVLAAAGAVKGKRSAFWSGNDGEADDSDLEQLFDKDSPVVPPVIAAKMSTLQTARPSGLAP